MLLYFFLPFRWVKINKISVPPNDQVFYCWNYNNLPMCFTGAHLCPARHGGMYLSRGDIITWARKWSRTTEICRCMTPNKAPADRSTIGALSRVDVARPAWRLSWISDDVFVISPRRPASVIYIPPSDVSSMANRGHRWDILFDKFNAALTFTSAFMTENHLLRRVIRYSRKLLLCQACIFCCNNSEFRYDVIIGYRTRLEPNCHSFYAGPASSGMRNVRV